VLFLCAGGANSLTEQETVEIWMQRSKNILWRQRRGRSIHVLLL